MLLIRTMQTYIRRFLRGVIRPTWLESQIFFGPIRLLAWKVEKRRKQGQGREKKKKSFA